MILSRVWYILLGVAIAVAIYQRNGKIQEPVNQNAATSEAVREGASEPAVGTSAIPAPAEKLYTILKKLREAIFYLL